MKVFLCISFGYLLGSVSPSALLSKLKKKSLRENGTGNLGATNVMLNFGKLYGVLVMLFDVLKAFFTVKLAAFLFPLSTLIPLVAGTAVVVGHIFPFYMKFKGGKGLASFGGLILAYDPMTFLILLIIGLLLMLILNYGVFMPVSASVIFPVFTWLKTYNAADLVAAIILGVVVVFAHLENLSDAIHGSAIKIREYIKNDLISNSK
jgi:glycerol-3-phosphate acyltransferase PlsY